MMANVQMMPSELPPREATPTEATLSEAMPGDVTPGTSMTSAAEAVEKRYLAVLSFGLGISQGCGLCFYTASGGYFGYVFADDRFLINLFAFFYLPPILISMVQILLDRRFDALLGIRTVIRFRIYLSCLMIAVLLAGLGLVPGPGQYPGEGVLVYGLGVVLGTFLAILLASSCLLFGGVDPRLVPYLVLGQTTAGVYTNVAAQLLGFEPACELWRARAFFSLASGSVGVGVLAYWVYNRFKLLENAYQVHESLLTLSLNRQEALAPSAGSSAWQERSCLGFPLTCWSMAVCQTLAIAMNMSLTPLANQVAHGDFDLTQRLILVKLLSDFVGRVVFLVIPAPLKQHGYAWRGLSCHVLLVWLLELVRVPLWALVYLWCIGSGGPSFLANSGVLLYLVWLPLISAGALSGSWCFVIAVTAAPDARKAEVNLLMALSVSAGYALGICIALLTR